MTEPFVRLLRRRTTAQPSGARAPDVRRLAAAAVVVARLPRPELNNQDVDERPRRPFRVRSRDALFELFGAPRGKSSTDGDDGKAGRGGSPVLSRLRFTRLIRTAPDDYDALLQNFSRAIDALKPAPYDIDPAVLVDVITRWDDDEVRRKAAYAYWSKIIESEPQSKSKEKSA